MNCGSCGQPKVGRAAGHRNGKPRVKMICVSCERARQKVYANSPRKREWDRRNPEKRRAHKIVENALLSGAITRKPCERCGASNAQAHHDDYSKPLDVKWLCPKDHAARHRELRCEQIAA